MVLWVGLFGVLIAVVCFVLFLILVGVVCGLVLLGLFACLQRCWYCFNSVDWCLITYCMAGFWFDYLVTCVVILRVLGLLCCLFGVFVDLDFVLLVVLVLVLLGLYLLPDLTRFACLDLAVVAFAWLVGLVVFRRDCGDDALVATFCFGMSLVFAVDCGFVWCCVCWLFS